MIPKAVCYGEVLWDVFSTHKKIGGAPLNVALRLNSFGISTNIISSVGNDHNGRELLVYVKKNKLDISTIQMNDQYPTGCVNVILDKKGSASYEIAHPVAWDKIQLTNKSIEGVKASDAFIFGSLASRDEVSKNTLLKLLSHAKFKVFDVNLRAPYYTMDLLLDLMKKSEFIKCNDDELKEICTELNCSGQDMEDQIKFLSNETNTDKICVTKGKDGAILLHDNHLYYNESYPIKVVDTVGAGDSFLAGLISKLLVGENPNDALDYACAVGALVAGKNGANSKLMNSEISEFRKIHFPSKN
jgi:fructokinase